MKAKDTAMSDEQIEELVDNYESEWAMGKEVGTLPRQVAKAQAEITAPIFFEEGRKAGIREVVDSLDWEETVFQTLEGSPIIRVSISKEEWQAKLLEWGVSKPEEVEENATLR